MKIIGNTVSFETCDKGFLKKFGFLDGSNMVLDYMAHNKTPFIYDKYQLAALLAVDASELCRTVKKCDKMYNTVTLKKKNGGEFFSGAHKRNTGKFSHAPTLPLYHKKCFL